MVLAGRHGGTASTPGSSSFLALVPAVYEQISPVCDFFNGLLVQGWSKKRNLILTRLVQSIQIESRVLLQNGRGTDLFDDWDMRIPIPPQRTRVFFCELCRPFQAAGDPVPAAVIAERLKPLPAAEERHMSAAAIGYLRVSPIGEAAPCTWDSIH